VVLHFSTFKEVCIHNGGNKKEGGGWGHMGVGKKEKKPIIQEKGFITRTPAEGNPSESETNLGRGGGTSLIPTRRWGGILISWEEYQAY